MYFLPKRSQREASVLAICHRSSSWRQCLPQSPSLLRLLWLFPFVFDHERGALPQIDIGGEFKKHAGIMQGKVQNHARFSNSPPISICGRAEIRAHLAFTKETTLARSVSIQLCSNGVAPLGPRRSSLLTVSRSPSRLSNVCRNPRPRPRVVGAG